MRTKIAGSAWASPGAAIRAAMLNLSIVNLDPQETHAGPTAIGT